MAEYEIKKEPENSEELGLTFHDYESAEKVLSIIANVVLGIGILVTIILLFTVCWVDSGHYYYTKDIVFNPIGFATTIGVLLSSIISWALLRVICNISYSLKALRYSKV